MKILVIIPCYNEQDNILDVVQNLKKHCPDVDYLVVNDNSGDDSEKLCRKHGLNYISNPYNLGIGGSVQCGYLYAAQNGYDITVQLDGDGQHNPKYLMQVVKPVLNGEADMAIGSRFITFEGFQTSFLRRLGITIISFVIFILTHRRIFDVTSGYRATNAKLTSAFAIEYAQDFPEPEAILYALKNRYTVCEVPVVMEERFAGISSINAVKSPYYMVKVILSLIVSRLK